MTTLRFREPRRLACMTVLACTALMVLTDTGSAFPLSGTHTAGEVAGSCLKSGGTFTNGSGGDFSCETKQGSVYCDKNGSCTGYCQKCPTVTKGINGILRPPRSAATASATPSRRGIPTENIGRVSHVSNSGGRRH